MKIVFYNKTLLSGGIEKCLEILNKYLSDKFELEIVYLDDSKLDPNIVNILSKNAKIYKLEEGMHIECDICIWCYLYFDYDKLKDMIHAKKYYTWIHSMPRILPDCLLDNEKYVEDQDLFICVSEAVKNHLDISKEGIVIHNFIDSDILSKANTFNPFEGVDSSTLKLSVVSRLSRGKGFDRVKILLEELTKRNIPFKMEIVGKGRSMEDEIKKSLSIYEGVHFAGYQDNPYPYIKNSDYLVQLSDDESWCNSITEAKILGVPVIVTNFESSKEQVTNKENGLIIDLNDKDYSKYINDIISYKDILKDNLKDFKYENEINKWLDILK